MKKLLSVAVSAGVLAGVFTSTPAHAAEPAPTNVVFRWADATHQAVRLSWDEASPQPNEILLLNDDIIGIKQFLTTADAGNQLDIPRTSIPGGVQNLRFGIATGTKEDRTSPLTKSLHFDSRLPAAPQLGSVSQAGTLLTIKWLPQAAPTDTTPNDPLDLTGTELFTPRYEAAGKVTALGPTWPDTEISFTNPVPTYAFSVAPSNEWGAGPAGAQVAGRTPHRTPHGPARGLYGTESLIQGSYGQPVERQVVLQARNSATSAWYVVGTTVGTTAGSYTFRVTNRGTRQYRVLTASFLSGAQIWYGGSTAPATLTTAHRVTSANFYTPTIKRGQTATADLNVDPRFTGRVDLQRWSGTTWVHVKDVLINSGFARGQFVSTTPGRVAYRYYVPTTTVNGLPVAAVYSPNFVLTTT
jgi:hypothetical protein